MSSIAAAPAELSKVIQGSKDESYTEFTPRAPRGDLTDLPPNEDEEPIHQPATATNDQYIPQHSLFRNNFSRGIDYRLAFDNKTRAIAQPSIGCIATSLWGAVGTPVLMGDHCDITFEQVFDAATDPGVRRMIIRTDTEGSLIVVDAEQGRPYVTVLDIQQAIIEWMKERRSRQGVNDQTKWFSRWVRLADDDGTEVEVEIWVWKGLSTLSMDMVSWHLHLCDA